MQFLNTKGANLVANLLKGTTLDAVTTWADQVKTKGKYAFTRTWHYVDANDNPPDSCSFDESRDCSDGKCLIGAIALYTDNAGCTKSTAKADRIDALKFISHFLGDITQPLHVCARDKGGNSDKITFDGKKKNLHSIWDTEIPEKRISDDFNGDQSSYASFLVQQIQSGSYKKQAAKWISRYGVADKSSLGNSLAAIDWATDSDALDCSIVWPAYDADSSQDFAGDYYTNAVPTVDLQIAKGGYRLADWINKIGATC
ncbi:hypothetical protein HK105_202731 [Polyrhizophydium stewartii]|uniref:Aspergillus nuclease S(1) n=1 Tax=Polyrhizophydium stewartii TaxID=2732419 RepID=A0ABR4NEB3_9FUNG